MRSDDPRMRIILHDLQERAKELNCLYHVGELLAHPDWGLEQTFKKILEILPSGWQYPNLCEARITFEDSVFESPNYTSSPWSQSTDIVVQGLPVGSIEVSYREQVPLCDEGQFLKEERKLLDTIGERIADAVMQRRLKAAFEGWEATGEGSSDKHEWRVVVEFVRETDPVLLERIARKMINHLSWSGVEDAKELLRRTSPNAAAQSSAADQNSPLRQDYRTRYVNFTSDAFKIAEQHLSDSEILACITTWIKEDKTSYLVRALETQDTPVGEIIEAIERFRHGQVSENELSLATQKGLRVSLIRRFFSESLDFINVAKQFVEVRDFYGLVGRIIYPPRSQGKLGGKSAGLLLAKKIIEKATAASRAVREVKIPKTWYMTSDWILHFVHYNHLEDVLNHKYLEIEQVRQEYPHLVALFKTSSFPSPLANGLALVLEEVGDRPLIVRSSSLLEDRQGSAFSGKYKSLFLGNQGTKEERMAALMDAIAEVYASIFGPDPTEYRAERGLLDVHEEMGVMIQEVVGRPVGKYFLPACSGVAFSNNEFRWSPRIKRTDGLIRLVPGLGTRAVDRVADDYPVLIAPGQPMLRVNVTVDETLKYSPKQVDVINLETNAFETVRADELLRYCGNQYPQFRNMVSLVNDRVEQPMGLISDLSKSDVVFTFEGLIRNTPFVGCIRDLLALLQASMGMPVDIEFAYDGTDLYILQCRPQSFDPEAAPVPIPPNLAPEKVIFGANRFVSNGRVPEITHIVYVDLEGYSNLPDEAAMREVGRAVSRLNKVLPKHQFILIGPGRWGSRGDIRLGVSVTYSDINNTAMLVEVARQRGNYLPELSFGTHFFQDLVESSIRYLPLYPDDAQTIFNEAFLHHSENVLQVILPEFAHLAEIVRVIDVPRETGGMILRVLMNSDVDQAVAYLDIPQGNTAQVSGEVSPVDRSSDDHWRWRFRMAQRIAAQLDGNQFGVKACYLIGSTKNATAGPASDIDLLIHFGGSEEQKAELSLWLDGWSRCLGEMNFLRTGYRVGGLLDVHLVDDSEVAARSGYAVKIDAITDTARKLPMREDSGD